MADPDRIQELHEEMGNPASYEEASSKKTTSGGQDSQESTNTKILLQDYLSQGSVGNRFLSDIFSEEKLTPHNEMDRIREMKIRNAFVEEAVSTVRNLMLGKWQRPVSEDEDTQEFFEKEWDGLESMKRAMFDAAEDFVAFGNCYSEVIGPSRMPTGFKAFNHPERIWVDKDEEGQVFRYIQEVPKKFANKADQEFKRYKVGYGSVTNFKTVIGNTFEADRVIHSKLGKGDVSEYGRSPLASTLSDHKILKEIERSMAIFARFKSVPKKAISAKDADGDPLPAQDFDQFVRDWNQTGDFENFITNGRQVDINDMDYAGKQANFDSMVDYIKRKITSVLGPEFYFHGETTTHAVSNDQKTTFFLKMASWRQQFKAPWDEKLQEIAEERGLSTDIHWEFGEFDFETDAERREKALKAWTQGLITMDEARDMADIPEAEDDQVGQAFKWELDPQPSGPMQQLMQKLKDMEDSGE